MLACISKTKPWPAPGLRSIFLAMLLRLPRALGARGNRNRNTSAMPRIHQADAKRMPGECQGNTNNTERMPRGMPGGCHVGHPPHLHQCRPVRREYSGIPSPLVESLLQGRNIFSIHHVHEVAEGVHDRTRTRNPQQRLQVSAVYQ